jgi:hypothetical protein
MRLPDSSPTITTPVEVTARPCGILKVAAVPKPFIDDATPLPAKVVTTPEGVMRRNRLFTPSTTITFPTKSIATDLGPLNAAVMPFPSVHAAIPDPASVVTTPERVTTRIRCPDSSGTITLSFESIVMPLGRLIVADVPMPLIEVAAPFPASVDTNPDGVTTRMRLFK